MRGCMSCLETKEVEPLCPPDKINDARNCHAVSPLFSMPAESQFAFSICQILLQEAKSLGSIAPLSCNTTSGVLHHWRMRVRQQQLIPERIQRTCSQRSSRQENAATCCSKCCKHVEFQGTTPCQGDGACCPSCLRQSLETFANLAHEDVRIILGHSPKPRIPAAGTVAPHNNALGCHRAECALKS